MTDLKISTAARAAVLANSYRARAPNTRSATELWLTELGTRFIEVRMRVKGDWVDENHVDDPSTILDTIKMSAERLGCRFAVVQLEAGGSWHLYDYRKGETKSYPSKEAAEMVAIHHG